MFLSHLSEVSGSAIVYNDLNAFLLLFRSGYGVSFMFAWIWHKVGRVPGIFKENYRIWISFDVFWRTVYHVIRNCWNDARRIGWGGGGGGVRQVCVVVVVVFFHRMLKLALIYTLPLSQHIHKYYPFIKKGIHFSPLNWNFLIQNNRFTFANCPVCNLSYPFVRNFTHKGLYITVLIARGMLAVLCKNWREILF